MSAFRRRPAPQPSTRTHPAPPFAWLEPTPAPDDGAARRARVARDELAARAGLLYRLGYTEAQATARLVAQVAWEFSPSAREPGAHRRPEALADAEIARLVTETFARRPG